MMTCQTTPHHSFTAHKARHEWMRESAAPPPVNVLFIAQHNRFHKIARPFFLHVIWQFLGRISACSSGCNGGLENGGPSAHRVCEFVKFADVKNVYKVAHLHRKKKNDNLINSSLEQKTCIFAFPLSRNWREAESPISACQQTDYEFRRSDAFLCTDRLLYDCLSYKYMTNARFTKLI